MYVRTFDRWVGWMYFAVGVIGLFVNHIGSYAALSSVETVINLSIGLSAMAAARSRHRTGVLTALMLGVALLFWGIFGMAWPQSILGTAEPLKTVIRIVTGLWGMYVAVHDVNEWRREVE